MNPREDMLLLGWRTMPSCSELSPSASERPLDHFQAHQKCATSITLNLIVRTRLLKLPRNHRKPIASIIHRNLG